MSKLEAAHEAAAALDENSTPDEVRAVLVRFREYAWPDGRVLAPGTIAWLIADFLPRWLEAHDGRS